VARGRITRSAVRIVVLLHVLVWATCATGFNGDAPGFLDGITLIKVGRIGYFPPGYALFLWPVVTVAPRTAGFAIAGVQHVMMVVALLALRDCVRPCLGEDAAQAGFLIAGLAPPTLFLPQLILTENLALFGMASGLWCALRRATLWDIAGGLLIGWATLARVTPIAAMALPLFLVHARSSVRETVRHTIRTLATAALVVIACLVWTGIQSGRFALTDSQGLHLYNRVVAEQFLIDRSGTSTRQLIEVLGHDLTRAPQWEVLDELRHRGRSYASGESLMGAVAREGIRRDPWSFLRTSFALTWREYSARGHLEQWADGAAGTNAPALLTVVPRRITEMTRPVWWLLESIFARVWFVLRWLPIAGLLVLPALRQPQLAVAVLAAAFGYLFASAQVEAFDDRYVVAVLPFLLMLVPAMAAPLLVRMRAGRP
jgi:hypothetical protein